MMNIHGARARKRQELEENGEKGFTLIELLVVVLIIGILTAIAVPIFLGQQEAARESAVRSDLANAQLAVIGYQTANPDAESVALDTATLGDYGFSDSPDTEFVTESVDLPSDGDTEIVATGNNKTFTLTFGEGIEVTE